MNKDKEVEVVYSREVEVDLMEKVANVKIMCKIRENMSGKMMTKVGLNEKVVIFTEEEVILIVEVVFVVIVLDVVKKGIDILSVDLLTVGKVTKMLCFKETLRVHRVDLRLEKI